MSQFPFNPNAAVFVPNFGRADAPPSTEESATSPQLDTITPPQDAEVASQDEVDIDALCEEIDMKAEISSQTTKPAKLDDSPAPTSNNAKASGKKDPDSRQHLNIVFIGHVDAGKSTTCGNILYLTGGVDDRTIEKYEREAKEKNRDSWFLAFVMDTDEEERQKGKTVEVGRAYFSTENRRFTLLDAPGHKAFVPNMIEGASQADVGVLIISARKGEFETGFEKGGQTREHALLAKTLGVSQIIVAINKMDEPTCCWSQERYDSIQQKLLPFLKTCGFNPAKDIFFVPISGLNGQNLLTHVSDPNNPKGDPRASWYTVDKPTLFQIFDTLTPPPRNAEGPLRIPILDGYKDNGIIALGKVEQGQVKPGMQCILMPSKVRVKVIGVFIEDDEVAYASVGENVRLKVMGCDEDALNNGSMLCSIDDICPVATSIVGRVGIVELLEHRPIVTAGYTCVMHAHTAREEVMLGKLLEVVDKKTKKKKANPQFVKNDCMVTVEISFSNPICLEEFEKCPQLGRFTLRDEGKTIAIGRVMSITEKV